MADNAQVLAQDVAAVSISDHMKKPPPKQGQVFVELEGSAMATVTTSVSQFIGVSAVNN